QVVEGVRQLAELCRKVGVAQGLQGRFELLVKAIGGVGAGGVAVGRVDPALQELVDLLADAGGRDAAPRNQPVRRDGKGGVEQELLADVIGIVGVGNVVARHLDAGGEDVQRRPGDR